ncbi:MAG: hypothetical protein GEU68_16060, partial [Actinobacteria bacterium]|nr:hypothetical protein [Actinomycetota bacterium]
MASERSRRRRLFLVLPVVLLLFGSSKLPQLGPSMGQASKEFRQGPQRHSGGSQRECLRLLEGKLPDGASSASLQQAHT